MLCPFSAYYIHFNLKPAKATMKLYKFTWPPHINNGLVQYAEGQNQYLAWLALGYSSIIPLFNGVDWAIVK
jgi:hypothetical protein